MNGIHTCDFEHPTLGRLVGRRRNRNVVQFRSIPYASVPGRFRQAKLIEELSPKQRMCTDYTYACPQQEQSMVAFGGPIPGEDQRKYDEFSCLNLTITAPAALLEPSCTDRVPVMVYVHGGGFVTGAHYGGHHDTTRMVTLACQESRPLIIVSIQHDLLDEAAKRDEEPCNFALYDQRLAFLWVRRNISGFGGNASMVTAFGESAGSASLCFHLSSKVDLFNRPILQSGTAATISPNPRSQKEEEYLDLLRFCGIDPHHPRRLEQLRNVPVAKIVEAAAVLKNSAFSPLDTDSFFPTVPDYLNHGRIIADRPWVEEIITGDTVYEGYLFGQSLKAVRPEDLCQHVSEVLGFDRASKVWNLYDISAEMDHNLFWTRLCVFCGDFMFSLPCHQLSKAVSTSGKPTYRYAVSLRNPFPGQGQKYRQQIKNRYLASRTVRSLYHELDYFWGIWGTVVGVGAIVALFVVPHRNVAFILAIPSL